MAPFPHKYAPVCRAGVRAVDLGGPKFETKHKNRCLPKKRFVNWGGQVFRLGGPGPPAPPFGANPAFLQFNPYYCKASQAALNEAATDHELCYYYYITMNELLNPETDERLCTDVCMIPV